MAEAGGWRRRWRRRWRAGDGVRRARNLQAGHVDRLERRAGNRLQRVQVGVVPAGVGRAAHEEGRAVVREHHPVLLERAQDHLVLRREAADVVARLEPEPGAHGRVARTTAARLVARRPDVRIGRSRRREADHVVDLARGHLVVADEPGQDRQARSIAGRPSERTHRVRVEIPRRTGPGCPRRTARMRIRAVQLPQPARVTIDDQHVAVAGGARAALDRSVPRDRIRAGVALVRVAEGHRYARLATGHGRVRDADRPTVPRAGAEVRLESRRRADAGDPRRRLRVNGQAGHIGVPEGIGRRHRARRCSGHGLALSRCCCDQDNREQQPEAHPADDGHRRTLGRGSTAWYRSKRVARARSDAGSGLPFSWSVRIAHMHIQPPSTARLMPLIARVLEQEASGIHGLGHRHEASDRRSIDKCLVTFRRHVRATAGCRPRCRCGSR